MKAIYIGALIIISLAVGLGMFAGSMVDFKMCDNTAVSCK